MMRYFVFLLIVQIQSCLQIASSSKSTIKTLPGYHGDLPFKLETGYVGIGEKEDVQLFYYFVESTRNPEEDPLVYHICGGPGASGLLPLLEQTGPVNLNYIDNLTLTMNPDAWTQVANIIYVDIPAGTGFSYAKTKEGWISSDTILAAQANEFLKKFLRDHPKFLRNPLYVSGISYTGIVIPKITLELYEGNERGDQPTFNIQGYIICSPLTDKFKDFNSRLEYAYRMGLISDDIHKSAIDNCDGNYVDIDDSANAICANSLRRYEECISHINFENILDPFCDDKDPKQDCERVYRKALDKWANINAVQKALNVRQGMIGEWETINYTLHYQQDKNDTVYYSYDIFSSFSDHKKLLSKNCRALIFSGDHDFTFPYVGVEQWIALLNLDVEVPWKPFFVDDQVGGYETKYAQNGYSLTYATVKGAGHSVSIYKPKESAALVRGWLSSQTYLSKIQDIGLPNRLPPCIPSSSWTPPLYLAGTRESHGSVRCSSKSVFKRELTVAEEHEEDAVVVAERKSRICASRNEEDDAVFADGEVSGENVVRNTERENDDEKKTAVQISGAERSTIEVQISGVSTTSPMFFFFIPDFTFLIYSLHFITHRSDEIYSKNEPQIRFEFNF
ncbi:hypothetical protein SSX86_023150 [Deinandra increscens subsp. villosa]|uniref:Peptidase S10, serine carboxypeptidase, Alpha/Beta hydrolase fold protein n=1 Tax=Deinandra increscens subsp. villosa TaxID=3103831 RepID=A0AAP0CK78_9ASTR